MKIFTLTEEHIKLISHFNIGWGYDEWGAPQVDPKRPYGNGDYIKDMAEILGIKPDFEKDEEIYFSTETDERLETLHRELETALKIVLENKTFKPGEFFKNESWHNWKRR